MQQPIKTTLARELVAALAQNKIVAWNCSDRNARLGNLKGGMDARQLSHIRDAAQDAREVLRELFG